MLQSVVRLDADDLLFLANSLLDEGLEFALWRA